MLLLRICVTIFPKCRSHIRNWWAVKRKRFDGWKNRVVKLWKLYLWPSRFLLLCCQRWFQHCRWKLVADQFWELLHSQPTYAVPSRMWHQPALRVSWADDTCACPLLKVIAWGRFCLLPKHSFDEDLKGTDKHTHANLQIFWRFKRHSIDLNEPSTVFGAEDTFSGSHSWGQCLMGSINTNQ